MIGHYLENVKANVAMLINVGMEAWRIKLHHGWLKRIIGRKFHGQFVGQTIIHSPGTTFDGTNPGEDVVTLWKRGDARISARLRNIYVYMGF